MSRRTDVKVAGGSGPIDQQQQAYLLETLGQLAMAFTHELNNLLGTIGNCSALIGRHLTNQDDIDDAASIAGAVEQAAAMSRQLASFAGHWPTTPEALAVSDVLRQMTAPLQLTLGHTRPIRLVLPAESPVVIVDRQHMELLVLNLALNAGESMPRGGTLTINVADSASPDDAGPRPQVRLAFSDQGAGMDPQVAAQACDPFFTTKTTKGIVGLGLTTVDGIVRRYGGSVTIESCIGSGTTVTVTLPGADHLKSRYSRDDDD